MPNFDLYVADLFGGDTLRRGGVAQFRPDGSVHVVNYANYDQFDKGVRISWDVHPGGDITGIHMTDQNDNRHLS